ncbi:MAG: glycosyltransferase family 1 protein [Candidatus Aenigmatarchaeota archaeon]
MKINLLAHTTLQSGVIGVSVGINKYINIIGKEFVKMGHDVTLTIRNDYSPKEKWIKPIYSPKFSWIPYPIFLYFSLKEDSDVYHSDYVTTGAPLIWRKKKHTLVSVHDAIPFTYDKKTMSRSNRFRTWWYMKCFKSIKKADAIFVLSDYSKRELLKYTDVPKDKIHVVYIGVDFDHFYPLPKKKHKNIRIGYFGGLDGRKNVILLVETFKKLVKKYDNIELHVGGGGKNLKDFKEMKIKNANFYGFVPDEKINEFVNSLDIFVYPTLDEGFGLPPLEAMATGVPVMAANTCSMPEVVGDAGLLVKPTIDSFEKGLEKLIKDKKLRDTMGKKSVIQAKKFTWEKCAKQTLEVYKKVLG